MKKVLVLEGSPRERGNTALVTDWVLKGLGKRGMSVERVRVPKLDLNGCQACSTCASTKGGAGCAQDDDMTGLYDRIIDCDLLMFTSPIFCWGVTGQLKLVTDRLFALMTGENMLKGKPIALVLTAGGSIFAGADLATRMYRDIAHFIGMKYLGEHIVAPCPGRQAMNRRPSYREEAKRFGKELRQRLKT
jgi:multimeric flavodoxin WrbA